ncbi:MAG TPA: ABC transporter substrate-binding protein [Beijerinckiaceae bacterium]|nr:ABC transporter substrate-binding protein [Beijerinckiaceae bacterium]
MKRLGQSVLGLSVSFIACASLCLIGVAGVEAQTATAQKLLPARIGVLRLASSGAVFIADAKKYFQAAGIAPKLVYFDAAQPIAVAAAAGSIDFGVTAFTAGMFNLAAKGGLSVIAGQSRETKGFPLNGILVATHGPNASAIKTPADLAGRSVGITQTGSSFHYELGLLAAKYHFKLSSVKIVPLQSMSNIAAAVKGGSVDAAILPVTVAKPLIASGAAKLLGWAGDMTPWQIGAAMVGRKDMNNTTLIKDFLTGYRRGAKAYHDVLLNAAKQGAVPVNDATKPLLAIIAKYTQHSIEQIRYGLPYVDANGALDVADVGRQITWYQAHGFVDKGFGVDRVIDKRFVPKP